MLPVNYQKFDELCGQVRYCTLCPRMDGSARVLSRAAGPVDAELMFVGEAPGRLGADESGIPFHGDQAGHNFEALLSASGMSRRSVFVTNAILCNPKDDAGRNATPAKVEVSNCAVHLRRQIELISPKIVVSLGAVALEALNGIERHNLTLGVHVRTSHKWFGRKLVPLYHPGQRAMIHRSFANQRSDYRFVYEQARRLGTVGRAYVGRSKADVIDLARTILGAKPALSYFALHKITYLLEYEATKHFGKPLTTAYFIRQKDGPYCTDLHIAKVQRSIAGISLSRDRRVINFKSEGDPQMISQQVNERFSTEEVRFLQHQLDKLRLLSDAELKTRAYMSRPMRDILREEQHTLANLYNTPIDLVVQ
jgi:uracil-DNA glycosylase family 4